jgi:hypothetical protein
MMSLAKSLFRSDTKPPPRDAAAKGMFRAKSVENLEIVNGKLQAVEQEIQTAEAALRDASLAAALAEPNTDAAAKGFEAIGQLQALRAQKELLLHARAKAQEAENARLTDLRSKADRARERALAQHAGVMEREAAVIEDACATLQASFTRAAAAQAASLALLPARLRQEFSGTLGLMTIHYLRQLVEEELGRLGRGSPAPLVPRFAAPHERRHDGFIPPLVETIKTVTSLRHRLSPIPEIAPVASSAGADALAPAEFQPSVGGDAASDEIREGGEPGNSLGSSPPPYTEDSEAY